ncbi:hypothetical protein Hypma_009866 [Hypsizygus marmoreus]|uniref:Nuclear pore complex NUP2/50/61 domain-containing protein n=1 Tax=Hypsizygus marmoreus TaxID=39966 RepID=A0A369JM64_HYPMA|nr:hypothetical protein Hypma_009866 [Hypsizygus marmoreus]
MKRRVNNQLTAENIHEESEMPTAEGFRRADPATLATRQIRGLPKRHLGAGSHVELSSSDHAPVLQTVGLARLLDPVFPLRMSDMKVEEKISAREEVGKIMM